MFSRPHCSRDLKALLFVKGVLTIRFCRLDDPPSFYVETKAHSPNLPKQIHRCTAAHIMPYDEREYEWLHAFLKVVTWMEDEFGYEKAKENTTSRHEGEAVE